MKLLGIDTELLNAKVTQILNTKTNGVVIVTVNDQNKTTKWTQKEVEDYISSN